VIHGWRVAGPEIISLGTLALLARLAPTSLGRDVGLTTRCSSSNVKENTAETTDVRGFLCRLCWHFALFQDSQDHRTAAVSSGVLRKVVATGELLATLVTLERFVVGVEGSNVTLEVFLASEPAVANITDKCLGWILSERLFAASTVGRS